MISCCDLTPTLTPTRANECELCQTLSNSVELCRTLSNHYSMKISKSWSLTYFGALKHTY
jgi:hypothetical protein